MANARSLRRAFITGTGMYVPPDIYTNDDLAKMMDTSDEWIQQRTGIRERRYAKEGIGASDLGVEAAKAALAMAGRKPSEIDLVIFATLTPDYYMPGAGVFLTEKLGMGTIPALDIRNQCSGFIYGLSCAQAFIASGQHQRVLLVAAETHSRGLDFSTRGRDVTVLFGDGAGAVVIEATDEPECGVLSTHLHADGAHRDLLKMQYPCNLQWPYIKKENLEDNSVWPTMDGRNVFKNAVSRMPEVINEALTANHLTPDDISLFIFHQANMRIAEAALKSMGQPLDKSFNNIQRYGNCSAASIPMCLDEAVRAGRIKRKDLVCLAAFGAGFTWASAVLRW